MFDSTQPYKQVVYSNNQNQHYHHSQTAGFEPSFTKSTMSASNRDPLVVNLEASMFGSRIRSNHQTQADDDTVASQTTARHNTVNV
jgi:hypothetical protein